MISIRRHSSRKKRFSAEQIVVLLRQIEVLMSQGKATPVACREAGISQQRAARRMPHLPAAGNVV
jgi:hypothetical protein